MHEAVRDYDGGSPACFEDRVNHRARDARLACAHLVGEHDTVPRQPLGHPRERCALTVVQVLLLMRQGRVLYDHLPKRAGCAGPREAHRSPHARAAPSSTSKY